VGRERPPLPVPLRAEVLFRSDHICCICRQRNKHVQIHHIDGRSGNNALANLAVVCLDCHSRVTGPQGLGRGYTPAEVRKYKADWEGVVAQFRSVVRVPVRHAKELISQIDLMVTDILASEGDVRRQRRLLDQLYQIHLWRGETLVRRNIVAGLGHLAVMAGLGGRALALMVAEKTWEICWHLAGPREVPWSAGDAQLVAGAVNAAGSVGHFNAFGDIDPTVGKAVCNALHNLALVGVAYKKRNVVDRVLFEIREILKAAGSGRPNANKRRKFVDKVLDLLRALKKLLGEGPGFRAQLQETRRLLQQYQR
jgi:hypothetical protein